MSQNGQTHSKNLATFADFRLVDFRLQICRLQYSYFPEGGALFFKTSVCYCKNRIEVFQVIKKSPNNVVKKMLY